MQICTIHLRQPGTYYTLNWLRQYSILKIAVYTYSVTFCTYVCTIHLTIFIFMFITSHPHEFLHPGI